MAKLAETVVVEWLNRQGFFTIHGVKQGVNEMDILAVRPEPSGGVSGWHVEAQVSFRPVGYVTPPTNAKTRTPQELADCVKTWIQRKYLASDKNRLRNELWPGVKWSLHFVHGVVREPRELELIRCHGVELHPFDSILESLRHDETLRFSGSAGGDLAEIVHYFETCQRKKIPHSGKIPSST